MSVASFVAGRAAARRLGGLDMTQLRHRSVTVCANPADRVSAVRLLTAMALACGLAFVLLRLELTTFEHRV